MKEIDLTKRGVITYGVGVIEKQIEESRPIVINPCGRCMQKRREFQEYTVSFICVNCEDKPENQIGYTCIHPYVCFDCNQIATKLYGDDYTIYGSAKQ
jgi:hypothetical protein